MIHLLLLAFSAVAGDAQPTLVEQWLMPSTFQSLVQAGGLVLLATLFASGKILTSGQHAQRIADLTAQFDARTAELKAHHERELAQAESTHAAILSEKDISFTEMKGSRDYYRGARLDEKERADAATAQLVESNEIGRAATHALKALNQVATERGDSDGRSG